MRVYTSLMTNGRNHTVTTVSALAAYHLAVTELWEDLLGDDSRRDAAVARIKSALTPGTPLTPFHEAAIDACASANPALLSTLLDLMAVWNARILAYAVAHDPAVRSPVIETFHAKILVADNNRAYIGSANMNRWSRDVSMECGVIVTGPCVRSVATLVDSIISIAEPLRL